ncbi:hypothetical protein B0H14DRAFT_2855780 [Mycena olivaceomarginata]|nr:hypothetical protein B0H14DRAFT_2855780 [Mycena olivaceomarginata]
MAGRTRSGARFSPHELFNIVIPHGRPPLEIIQTDISLDDLIQQSIVDEDMHAACLDEGCMHDDDDEWEDDEVSSEPPSTPPSAASSPLSSPPDSPVNSRPHSPIPSASAPHSSPSPPSAPPHSPIPSVSVPAPHPTAAKRRGKRRQKARDDQMPYDRKVDPRYPQSHRQQPPHTVPIDIAAAPAAARDAWIGRRSKKPSGCIRTLPELKDKGGKVIEWNGRDPKLIVDKEGRIIAILLGTPEDPDWPNVIQDAIKAMKRARRLARTHGAWVVGSFSSPRTMSIVDLRCLIWRRSKVWRFFFSS